MSEHFAEIGTGLLLLFVGVISVIRRHFTLGIGGGKTGLANPVFTITPTESRALGFGFVTLLSATVTLASLLYVYATNDEITANNGVLGAVALLGLAIAAFGFGIASFFELLDKVRSDAENGEIEARKLP
jgi:hypothetical protein